jgi:SPP1 gp7 family putative phage head morphogenesis protein
VSPENQKLLWQHYYDTLAKGVDAGYNSTIEMYDPALAHSLKYDIAKFSAFKETSFRKQLESALTKNGKIVPWSEFKKTADVLNIDYNRRWLKTEYNHTVATANMAQQWQDFEADKDLYPNLRYNAVNDGRTREQHKAWDGLILPIEHVFWKSHYPPNDWGCRCNVEQTDDKPTVEMPEILIKGAFNNNAALSGKVFNEVPYASGLSSAEVKVVEKQARRNFEEKEFKTFEIPFKGKGKIISSNLVNNKASDYNDVLACCKHFAKSGSITELVPRFNNPLKNELYKKIYKGLEDTIYWGKCPDFKVGKYFYELEGFDGLGNYSNMMKRGLKQSSRIVLKKTLETEKHLKKLIKFNINEGKVIDEVWIFDNNKLELFYPIKTQ